MSPDRLERVRRWHLRRVLSPLPVRLEDYRWGWYFGHKLEGRWSASRRKWMWREPRPMPIAGCDPQQGQAG